MPLLLRVVVLAAMALPLFAAPAPTPAPADNKVKPIEDGPLPGQKPSPQAAPAFLDVVTFSVRSDGETKKMVVISGPGLLRVDEPDEGYSVIYNAETDHYTGLEHRNYTWWEFSWSEVRDAIASTKRYANRLEELNAEGVMTADPTALSTNAPASASSPDNAGYVWRQTADKKRISGFDCQRWTGDTVSGESVVAWCTMTPVPKLQAAMEQLRKINEPMALVPIRTLVPSNIFPIYDGLIKGNVTPIFITWGGNLDKNHFGLLQATTRDGRLELFNVPKLYVKTTLITMDGIIDQPK